jgi:MFS family permease
VDESARRYEGWRVTAASAAGVFVCSLTFYSFGVFLKPIIAEFAWSRSAVATAYGVMAGTAAVTAPVMGWLFDRVGTRRVLLPCMTLFGCAVASLSLLTPRLAHLYAVFSLLGFAAAGTSTIAYTRAVASWFDRHRGTALAIMLAGGGLGGIVHPPLGQALIAGLGWRAACLVLGALMLALGLLGVVPFVRERAAAAASAAQAVGATVAEALRSRAFWILMIVVFGTTVAANGVIVHLAALLTDHGVPAGSAALAVSVFGAANLVGRLVAGWLLDRFQAGRVAFLLLSIAAVGTFVLSGVDSLATGMLAAALLGFGCGGELDVTPYLLSRYFGLRSVATLYGFTYTALGTAGVVGPILLGRAFDATGSYEVALAQFGAGMLAVALLLLWLPRYGNITADSREAA